MKSIILVFLLVLFELYAFSDNISVSSKDLMGKNITLKMIDGTILQGVFVTYQDNIIFIKDKLGNVHTLKMNSISNIYLTSRDIQSKMGSSYSSFNLLGFLQFGPIFGFDLKLSKNIYAGVHLRWAGLGLLYQLVASNGFEDSPSIFCSAYGIQVKHFLSAPRTNNKFYFGFFSDFAIGWSGGDKGTLFEWRSNFGGLVFAGNFGRRWRYPSRFYLDFGLIAGFYIELCMG